MELTISSLRILLLFCFVTTLASAEYNKRCGERYVERNGLCCDPIFDCGPGSEIQPCQRDYAPETCQKCQNGMVQPDHITSKDKEENISCFTKLRECTARDLTYSRTTDSPFQPKGCKCNINACFIEEDSICMRKEECKAGYELDPVKGVCRKCPADKYKLHVGCSPCITNKTIWLLNFTDQTPSIPVQNSPLTHLSNFITLKTTSSKEIQRNGTTSTLTLEKNEPNVQEVSSKKSTMSNMYLYITIAAIIGIIVILIAVSLFIKSTIIMKRAKKRTVDYMEMSVLLKKETNDMATNTGESLHIIKTSSSSSSGDSGVTGFEAKNFLSEKNQASVNFQKNNLDRPNAPAQRVGPVQLVTSNIDTFSTNPGPSTRQIGTAMKIVSSSGCSSDESINTRSLSSSGGENEVVFNGDRPQENDEGQHLTQEKYS